MLFYVHLVGLVSQLSIEYMRGLGLAACGVHEPEALSTNMSLACVPLFLVRVLTQSHGGVVF